MKTKTKPISVTMAPVQYKSLPVKDVKVDEDSRTVSGYLSVFNVVDSDGDYIVKGAFAKSINERGPNSSTNRKIAFLWQHDMKDPIGRMTVLREDDIGLYFEAVLDLGVDNADRALLQLKSGTLNQFSIGYQYVWDKMEYDDVLEAFVCKEINLFEGSVVTLGANEWTFFDGMKAAMLNDAKIKMAKETESFIKRLPVEFQYSCRQLLAKNIHLAVAKTKDDPDNDGDNDTAATGDDDRDHNLDYLHKAIGNHAKGMQLVEDYQGQVDNNDVMDCMKDMLDTHTDCMSKMLDIKAAMQGQKSLPAASDRTDEPISDFKAALEGISFF